MVGVIANLSLWFALHVLFDRVDPDAVLALPLPELSSFNVLAFALTCIGAVLMVLLNRGFVITMAILAALSLGWTLV